MDRQLIWPGAVPLETDLLNTNRNAMMGLGRLAQDVLGSSTVASGLACTPTTVASMTVNIGAGALYSVQNVDNTAYSSLPANTTDQILKQGMLLASAALQLTMAAPTGSGTSVIYLIEAAYSEVDGSGVVLPYYNSANPAVPFSGPANNGQPSYTKRGGTINIQSKAGVASASPVAPSADTGFVPLYYVTIAYGQTTITAPNIAVATGAPFISGGLGSYMPIAGGAFTGAVTGPTPVTTDNTTKLATTAMVQAVVVAGKFATLASPALTGTPTAPTPATGDSSTTIATTAMVQAVLATSAATQIGIGQTWQNLSGSRAIGTTYTNATNKPIAFTFTIGSSTSGSTINITIGGVGVTLNSLSNINNNPVGAWPMYIVPPGASYSVAINGGSSSLASWSELR